MLDALLFSAAAALFALAAPGFMIASAYAIAAERNFRAAGLYQQGRTAEADAMRARARELSGRADRLVRFITNGRCKELNRLT